MDAAAVVIATAATLWWHIKGKMVREEAEGIDAVLLDHTLAMARLENGL